MDDPRNNPKREWLMAVLSNAPVRNYQEARYKAEWMLEVCAEAEADIEEYNAAGAQVEG